MDRRTFFGALAALPVAATVGFSPALLGYDFSDSKFVYSDGTRIGWLDSLDNLPYDGMFVERLCKYAGGVPLFQPRREHFFWNAHLPS